MGITWSVLLCMYMYIRLSYICSWFFFWLTDWSCRSMDTVNSSHSHNRLWDINPWTLGIFWEVPLFNRYYIDGHAREPSAYLVFWFCFHLFLNMHALLQKPRDSRFLRQDHKYHLKLYWWRHKYGTVVKVYFNTRCNAFHV